MGGLPDDAKAVVDSCEAEKALAATALTEAGTQVETRQKVVEDSGKGAKEAKEAEKEGEKVLKAAEKAVASFDAEQEAKIEEKDEAQKVLDDGFLFLKAGEWAGKFPSSKLAGV